MVEPDPKPEIALRVAATHPSAARRGLVHSLAWRRVVTWSLAGASIAVILFAIEWRDIGELTDGTRFEVIDKLDESYRIVTSGDGRDASIVVTSAQINILRPGLISLFASMNHLWIIAYFACASVSAFLLLMRWCLLLRVSRRRPTPLWCGQVWARSQVISVLPTSQVGGDIYRVERSARWTGSLGVAAAVVLVERILGLIALFAVGGIGVTIGLPIGAWSIAICVFAGSALLGVLASSCQGSRRRFIGHMDDMTGETTHGPGRFVRSLYSQLRGFSEARGLLIGGLGLSILAQGITPLGFFAIDRALGLETPLWCYLIAVPLVTIVQFLPVHVAGIGVVEGGLWLTVGRWASLSVSEIVALSAAHRLLWLFWLGVLAIAFLRTMPKDVSRPSPGAARALDASACSH